MNVIANNSWIKFPNSLDSMEWISPAWWEQLLAEEVKWNIVSFSKDVISVVTWERKTISIERVFAILQLFPEYKNELKRWVNALGVDNNKLPNLINLIDNIVEYIIMDSISETKWSSGVLDFSQFFDANYTIDLRWKIISLSKDLAWKALVKAWEKAWDIWIEDKWNAFLNPKVKLKISEAA